MSDALKSAGFSARWWTWAGAGLRIGLGKDMGAIEEFERAQLREISPSSNPATPCGCISRSSKGAGSASRSSRASASRSTAKGSRETFTVRKQSFGVGVERTFPVHSPKIDKIEVMAVGDVARAKLYYLRDKLGKKARVKEKRI